MVNSMFTLHILHSIQTTMSCIIVTFEMVSSPCKTGSVVIQRAVPHHEVPALIAASDICIAHPGLNDRNVTQDACPIKVLECMASSRPSVASNMPIVREHVREDVDALLFSPSDPDDLARKVLTLLNDIELSQRLAPSASERALTKFTWHESQKKLVKVYKKIVDT